MKLYNNLPVSIKIVNDTEFQIIIKELPIQNCIYSIE